MRGELPRLSRLAVVAVVVFLLAQIVVLIWRLDRQTTELHAVQSQVVNKLAQVLAAASAADDAARAAGQVSDKMQQILDDVKGIDPALVAQAVQKALSGAVGPQGPQGPPGPSGSSSSSSSTATATSMTTTSTAAPTTTTTAHTQGSTTTSSTTTTTTTRCGATLLGIKLLCG